MRVIQRKKKRRRRKQYRPPHPSTTWVYPKPPADAVLLLSPEDEHLRQYCEIRPRSRHKRAGVQMYTAVMVRTLSGRKRRRRAPQVYKLIMQRVLGVRRLPRGYHVDHINGNPLDNRRENLRMATPMQNAANAHKRAGCSSVFKGVSWDKKTRKWKVELNLTVTPRARGKRGKAVRFCVGWWDVEEYAAKAYDCIAREWYGEFARLNYPHEDWGVI